jgi:beta-lactam-binding protein with PASTA domain
MAYSSSGTSCRPVAAVALLAALLLAWLVAPAAAQPGMPEVTGLDLRTAVERLERWDPDAGVVTVPDRLPAALDWGQSWVHEQRPVVGDEGFEVELVVRTVVPAVVGRSTEEALDTLAASGLTGTAPFRATVTDQSVQAGAVVPLGLVVDLDTTVGDDVDLPPRVAVATVPSVVGLAPAAALVAFEEAGLDPALRVRGVSPAGTVVDQEPPPGTPVVQGSVATAIAEGVGTPDRGTVVPDIVGLSVAEAEELLAAGGLRLLLRVEPDVPFDEPSAIRSQSPPPGGEVGAREPGEVVGFAEPLVRVPDLQELDEDGARIVLEGKGLTLAVEGAAGVVTSQEPGAEALVPAGTVVLVRIETEATPLPPPGDDGTIGGERGSRGEEPASATGTTRWLVMAAACLTALAVGAGVARRSVRRRRRERVRTRVQARPVAAPCDVVLDEAAGADCGHSVRLAPHLVPPVQTVEEVGRR